MDTETKRQIAELRGHVETFKSALGARNIGEVGRIGKEIIAAIKKYETEIASMQQALTAMEKQIVVLQNAVKALQPVTVRNQVLATKVPRPLTMYSLFSSMSRTIAFLTVSLAKPVS